MLVGICRTYPSWLDIVLLRVLARRTTSATVLLFLLRRLSKIAMSSLLLIKNNNSQTRRISRRNAIPFAKLLIGKKIEAKGILKIQDNTKQCKAQDTQIRIRLVLPLKCLFRTFACRKTCKGSPRGSFLQSIPQRVQVSSHDWKYSFSKDCFPISQFCGRLSQFCFGK